MRKSQMTFPRQLSSILLSPEACNGRKCCADFQAGARQGRYTFHSGADRCAALFRRSRTRHGNHPGSMCGNTKRHAGSAEADAQEEPVQKEMKMQNPGIHIRPSYTSMPDAPDYVTDDSIMRQMLPGLEWNRGDERGNRIHPKPLNLVAKRCSEKGRGELRLVPLPTAERMSAITQTNHSNQIHCLKNCPENVPVLNGGEWGMNIPDTLAFRCETSNPQARLKDKQEILPCVPNSLIQGDNTYCHCVTGISRAPRAATVISAELMMITFEQGHYFIDQVRNINIDKDEKNMKGPWAYSILRQGDTNSAAPTGFSSRAPITGSCGLTLHATTLVNR